MNTTEPTMQENIQPSATIVPPINGHDHPARPPNARAAQPSESTRQRWERMARVTESAREIGRADGLRDGYRSGWRWGLCCGTVAGVIITSIGWSIWLTATAPNAAPPSAQVRR